MPNRDILQTRVHECQQFARIARDAEMRQRWLDMAEEWTRLGEKGLMRVGTPVD